MRLFKLIAAAYVVTGILFTTIICLLACAMKRKDIFKYKQFPIFGTLLWPYFVFYILFDKN